MEGESNIYGSEFAEAVINNPGGATRTIRFETGRLAKQAAGSVTIYQGDTLVLSAGDRVQAPQGQPRLLPLTVDVEERMYAAGKIPGSFFRREGRPSEDAILTCRLTDRPLRPSFKKGLRNEIQIVSTVLALDPDHLYDVLAINSAACSVLLSGLPFTGPVGATRVACINGEWVAFPTHTELEDATFDMVVAGRMLERRRRRDHDGRGRGHQERLRGHQRRRHRPHRGRRGGRPRGRQAGHRGRLQGAARAQGEVAQGAPRVPGLPRLRRRRARRRHRRGPRTSSPRS